jgi:hypothetical protein
MSDALLAADLVKAERHRLRQQKRVPDSVPQTDTFAENQSTLVNVIHPMQ